MMEWFKISTSLSIILLTCMLSPCASLQISAQILPHARDHMQHSVPALPRKLKLNEEEIVKSAGNKQYYMPYKRHEQTLPDKSHHKEAKMVHTRKGTRQEWLEGADTYKFFTMDYGPVRRRRPIHNKFVPVAP